MSSHSHQGAELPLSADLLGTLSICVGDVERDEMEKACKSVDALDPTLLPVLGISAQTLPSRRLILVAVLSHARNQTRALALDLHDFALAGHLERREQR